MPEHANGQRSPLAGSLGVDSPRMINGVQLAERAFYSHVNVRADASDTAVMTALGDALNVSLPLSPNHCTINDNRQAFWLSPNEWLVISSHADVPRDSDAVIAAQSILADKHIAVTDVSSGQTIIELSGSNAAAALQRGCPLDIDPKMFPIGRCAQTHINHINILLWPVEGPSGESGVTYQLVVRRSFADYLWRWLAQVQSRLTVAG